MRFTNLQQAMAALALQQQQADAAKAANLRRAANLPAPKVGPRVAR